MLNTAPCNWTIDEIAEYIKTGPVCRGGRGNSGRGTVIVPDRPARPFGEYSFRSRFRLAWAVFTGRADALFWCGQMPKAY